MRVETEELLSKKRGAAEATSDKQQVEKRQKAMEHCSKGPAVKMTNSCGVASEISALLQLLMQQQKKIMDQPWVRLIGGINEAAVRNFLQECRGLQAPDYQHLLGVRSATI